MLGKILTSGQLGKLASFVSPAFFDVMPRKALLSKTRELYSASKDREAFRRAVAGRSNDLRGGLPEVVLVTPAIGLPKLDHAAQPSADWKAAHVTELYFRQLFHGDVTLLDLRASAFSADKDRLIWHPAAWQTQWSADFIAPLRELYRGFYTHDDAMFRRGLAALSLTHCEDLFRAHFGGDQARVTFQTRHFIDTFHEVFMRCKAQHIALHPDFLPLGIYLAALYDHLEELAVPVDVASALARVTAAPHSTQESIHA